MIQVHLHPSLVYLEPKIRYITIRITYGIASSYVSYLVAFMELCSMKFGYIWFGMIKYHIFSNYGNSSNYPSNCKIKSKIIMMTRRLTVLF